MNRHGHNSVVKAVFKGRVPNWIAALVVFLGAVAPTFAQAPPPGMALIPTGMYHPLFRSESDPKEVRVKSFYLDSLPVTNGAFLEFVRANPRWQRSRVKKIFADEFYLKGWAGDLDPGSNAPANVPVTDVSWFAAKAYAQWKGKRLPTVAEWEYAASASLTQSNGEQDAEFKRQVLKWYCTPATTKPSPVGLSEANFWGIHDLHGLVWEWVADFNSALLTGGAQGDTGLDRGLFCGGGAQGAGDVQDYPAFMRYAFRSSLKADYCVHNLGFRCAKDL